MRKTDRVKRAVEALEKLYPEAICSLTYSDPFQLLVATRLSAQCTDKRVNMVTPDLIKTCGLYKTKAKDLIGIGQMITEEYEGKVPDTIEELTKLPGVGRKTANLVCGDIFGKPAVVTDTHFIRISNRLGFVSSTNPLTVEKEMRKLLPPEKSNDFCHRTVLFGRDICVARKPKCEICSLNEFCPKKF